MRNSQQCSRRRVHEGDKFRHDLTGRDQLERPTLPGIHVGLKPGDPFRQRVEIDFDGRAICVVVRRRSASSPFNCSLSSLTSSTARFRRTGRRAQHRTSPARAGAVQPAGPTPAGDRSVRSARTCVLRSPGHLVAAHALSRPHKDIQPRHNTTSAATARRMYRATRRTFCTKDSAGSAPADVAAFTR